MAAIDDLIAQIQDVPLRERLAREVALLQRSRRFGLVFEEHLPELLPIYSALPKPGDFVSRRGGQLTELWLVLKADAEEIQALRRGAQSVDRLLVREVVVVRQFGDPIFPALVPMEKLQRGDLLAPWHTLIEADNFHALQLLEYLYAGQVDCIYIDPPYNTGARDWKYNNDYVDENDTWRHSKWLAMLKRRLEIAFRLLKETGIVVITIDDGEVHRLKSLIEDYFSGPVILGTVLIRNTPQGRATTKGFAISHEYALFVGRSERAAIGRIDRSVDQMARYNQDDELGQFEWVNFRKPGGTFTYRKARPKQYYPIYASGSAVRIPNIEWQKDTKEWRVLQKPDKGEEVVWPIDADGNERIWSWGNETARRSLSELTARPDQKGRTGIYRKLRPNKEGSLPSCWWDNPLYSATEHGTNFLRRVFSESQVFPFPKSIYAVAHCLRVAGASASDALVLDFFAGSGTTLNAVNLLNAADGGKRRCIMVTNNEVSLDEEKAFRLRGIQPGDEEWERHGVCRSISWPRCRYTIDGKREDGSPLPGEYFTGQLREVEKPRQFTHLGFLSPASLDSAGKKKQLLALIGGIPQSAADENPSFIVSAQHPVSVLFDDSRAEKWLDALNEQDHITQFVIVTSERKRFEELRSAINELLGPMTVTEELRRPVREGFPANLEYFRLDFLDKDQVALKRRLREILPILWMRAGCIGPRPELRDGTREPAFLLPDLSNFAVLIDEMQFPSFRKALTARNDISHVFLVTDSHEAFEEMAGRLKVSAVIQLYRDYLENFMINKGRN